MGAVFLVSGPSLGTCHLLPSFLAYCLVDDVFYAPRVSQFLNFIPSEVESHSRLPKALNSTVPISDCSQSAADAMPSNPRNSKKRRSSAGGGEDYESDNGFVADAPKSKKAKTAAPPARVPVKSTKPANSSNGDDDEFWEITSNRRVNISEFKGQRMVNIREYYEDKSSGAMLPGKKVGASPLLNVLDCGC